jgi:hypothetical protein
MLRSTKWSHDKMGPGSAEQHYVLHRVRDTESNRRLRRRSHHHVPEDAGSGFEALRSADVGQALILLPLELFRTAPKIANDHLPHGRLPLIPRS